MKYLLFDITNLLHKTFFVHKNEDDDIIAGLATHTALVTLNKYYKKYLPHKVVMCFDRSSWRKEYTASDECISQKPYKGNRRQNMTKREEERYHLFLNHMSDFEMLVRDHTTIITLAEHGLEADDLIAGIVQTFSVTEPSDEFIIISSDQDFIQLLGYPQVQLINPADGKPRTLQGDGKKNKGWNGDARFFMFEKCIRGDRGDNVQSAFPKVRRTRIEKAYYEPFEHANLMMETWTDPKGNEFKVKDLFEENKLLMDLQEQPGNIRKRMVMTILKQFDNPGKFSYFHFMQFLGNFELKKVAEQAEQFVPMLSR